MLGSGVGDAGTGARSRYASIHDYRAFPSDHFDYIVIDEFHHAAADSYRRLIAYFDPAFLLGLTATPDRMDGASLLDLCGNNLVFQRNRISGISRKRLVPFRYFGVADSVDFAPTVWRSGRFDADKLTRAVETQARAQAALDALQEHAKDARRVLVFCVSQTHADFMATFFADHGPRGSQSLGCRLATGEDDCT